MKEKKLIKTKIGVGSVVKENVVEMEENTREGRTRNMRKYVVGRFHYVAGNNKFAVISEYGKKK